VHGKPIVQYVTPGDEVNRIEDIIGLADPLTRVTFTDVDELVAHVDRLVANAETRRTEGEKLRRVVVTPEEFARNLRSTIESGKTFDGPTVEIDYRAATAWYLSQINDFSETIERTLARNNPFACLWRFPKAAARLVADPLPILKTLMDKIKRV
jgi:hypothetical protein